MYNAAMQRIKLVRAVEVFPLIRALELSPERARPTSVDHCRVSARIEGRGTMDEQRDDFVRIDRNRDCCC